MPATGILMILLAIFVMINVVNGNLPDLFTNNATIGPTPKPTQPPPTALDGGTNHPPTKGPF